MRPARSRTMRFLGGRRFSQFDQRNILRRHFLVVQYCSFPFLTSQTCILTLFLSPFNRSRRISFFLSLLPMLQASLGPPYLLPTKWFLLKNPLSPDPSPPPTRTPLLFFFLYSSPKRGVVPHYACSALVSWPSALPFPFLPRSPFARSLFPCPALNFCFALTSQGPSSWGFVFRKPFSGLPSAYRFGHFDPSPLPFVCQFLRCLSFSLPGQYNKTLFFHRTFLSLSYINLLLLPMGHFPFSGELAES